MMKTVLVVIVTWNGMKWIKRCLDSLRSSSYPVKTIVIDNGSSDNTVSFIRNNYSEVEVRPLNHNLGFGQANNIGLRLALNLNVDYVYLLNQDAYIYPDMFTTLLEVADKHSEYAILSPLQIYADCKKLDHQFRDYISNVSAFIVEDVCLNQMQKVYTVDCVPAAGWLLPLKTIEMIGGFDPIFFHYGEDHQYAQRVIYHGFKIGIVPCAKMIHDRDGFGNPKIASQGAIERSIKTEILLNINLSRIEIIRKLTKLFFLFVYESIRCAFRGNFSIGITYYFSFFACFPHLREYKKNRNENKKVGALWLFE